MPGPQQIERGEVPMLPSGTPFRSAADWMLLSNRAGLNAKPPFLRMSWVWKRGSRLGSPTASKSNVLSNSSLSACEVMRIGKPLWRVSMPDISHPSRTLPLNPEYLGTGRSHTKLKTKRCRASYLDTPYVALKLKGFRASSKLDALSIVLLHVYEAWNFKPCEKRFSNSACIELYLD